MVVRDNRCQATSWALWHFDLKAHDGTFGTQNILSWHLFHKTLNNVPRDLKFFIWTLIFWHFFDKFLSRPKKNSSNPTIYTTGQFLRQSLSLHNYVWLTHWQLWIIIVRWVIASLSHYANMPRCKIYDYLWTWFIVQLVWIFSWGFVSSKTQRPNLLTRQTDSRSSL